MLKTNKLNLHPLAQRFLEASQKLYSRGQSNRSITQLIQPPQPVILARDHSAEIETDLIDGIWSTLGTAVHEFFETHATGDDVVTEERLFTDELGWTISGAIDAQFTDEQGRVALIDYKVTSVWTVIYNSSGKSEWINQMHGYRWLYNRCKGVDVDKLSILAILRDWKKRDAQTRGSDYPDSPIQLIDIPLWTVDEMNNYVKTRILTHQEAEYANLVGEPLPECSDAERWLRSAKYAVKKANNKRAMRVLDSEEDAEEYIKGLGVKGKGLVVEKRESEPTRCKDYCEGSKWCVQYQSELEGSDEL